MTNRRGNNPPRSNGPNHPENSIPNSVARRRATGMGSTFSSSRRGTRNNNAAPPSGEEGTNSNVSDVYSTRYSHRSLNLPHRVRAGAGSRLPRAVRRHTTTATTTATTNTPAATTVRESSEQTPGPRRSARISSRMSEAAMEVPSVVSSPTEERRASRTPAHSRPVSIASSVSRPTETPPIDEGWQWREFTISPHLETRTGPLPPIHTPSLFSSTPTTPTPSTPVPSNQVPSNQVPSNQVPSTQAPATHVPSPPAYPSPAPSVSANTISLAHNQSTRDSPDNDVQSVEIVRVVPHRLIEIPSDEPFEPRPPPRQRPMSGRSSQNSGILRRARRLLRDSSGTRSPQTEPEPSLFNPGISGNVNLPSSSTQSAASDVQFAGSSSMSDEMLRGRLFEHAENEALNNMITANERSQRLRLLRLGRRQESDVSPRERLITGLLRRRENQGESSAESSELNEENANAMGPTRLRMFEVPGQGAILVEDIRPETSLRMSLLQAQYLQEVLLRISSLLDNLHILSQMNERMEDDPRLRTILAFATLNPDNMSYEQLLMLDELLPRNQGATKEVISHSTSLQQYKKSDDHENDSCIICITDFEENDGIRMLPCCHIYHFACVDNWLSRKKTCPMCRSSIDEKPSTAYLERLQKFKDFNK